VASRKQFYRHGSSAPSRRPARAARLVAGGPVALRSLAAAITPTDNGREQESQRCQSWGGDDTAGTVTINSGYVAGHPRGSGRTCSARHKTRAPRQRGSYHRRRRRHVVSIEQPQAVEQQCGSLGSEIGPRYRHRSRLPLPHRPMVRRACADCLPTVQELPIHIQCLICNQ
jgi:hypothetical protein